MHCDQPSSMLICKHLESPEAFDAILAEVVRSLLSLRSENS